MSASDVASACGTDPERGLAAAEAARRLRDEGSNTLLARPPPPAWRRWLAQLQDPLVVLLLVAIGIALLAWVIEGRRGWPLDALVIAAVVLLNAILGRLQEARAESAVAELGRLSAAQATVQRDGRPLRVEGAAVVRGDLLLLAEGDAVAADARLLQASSLRVQEASLTGESEAVLKDAAVLPRAVPPGDRLNMVFKGTAVAQGSARAVVTATGMATEMGAIARLLDATVAQPTPLQREVAHTGRLLGGVVVAIALVVVGTILVLSPPRSVAELIPVLLLGVSLAVAAVPEGLPAILSVVLALGVQRMARHQAVLKGLATVETLGCASVIATDKTGTLTRAEMTLQRVVTASGSTGVGDAPQPPGPLRDEQAVVLSGGSVAGNARLVAAVPASGGAGTALGDPTELAFLVAARRLGLADERGHRFTRLAERPFSAERQMMSVVVADHAHGGARRLICKGAPGVLLPRCSALRVGMAVQPLDDAGRARLLAQTDAMADEALRTLAVAYRALPGDGAGTAASQPDAGPDLGQDLEHDLVLAGIVGMMDPLREGAAEAVAEARRAGIRVVMITGDHARTAARIAADLGLAAPGQRVLGGAELAALDDTALAAAVRETAVFARVTPADKLRIVRALQAGGEVVAMTGDGVNDAPALKAADIGIAMGVAGTEVSRQAARMILVDDNFATIVRAVREGRGVFDNIRKFLRYLLSSNMGEVLAVFGGVVGAGVIGLDAAHAGGGSAVVLPLLATQLLWINLVTDLGPALALGVDPPVGDPMARPPRPPSERLIDARMWRDVFELGVVVALLTLLAIDLHLPGGLVEGQGDLATARTAGFTVLVLASLFNCLCARSDTTSAFVGLWANGWLWAAIASSAALQVAVVHLGWLNRAFGTVPLTAGQWALCTALASGVLVFSEARKAWSRWRA